MICNECKSKFGQAKEISAEDFYGVSDLFDYSCGEKIKICPNCESSDIYILKLTKENIYGYKSLIGNSNIKIKSHNVIDLIKIGDYVNGYKVLEICTGNFELNNPLNVKALKLEFIKEDINPNIPFFKRYNFITNNQIKSIVTKEQFDSMKYEVDSNE